MNARLLRVALAALVCVAGCQSLPGGKAPTPQLVLIEVPDRVNRGAWATLLPPHVPPPEVLPTRARLVRLVFSAPPFAVFGVSLRALDGTRTPLVEGGGQLPSSAGIFRVIGQDATRTPTVYRMEIRAPLALADPTAFDVEVVNRAQRTDVTDSDPMVVPLRKRRIFTVTVKVEGDGHVTSNPSGISCGTAYSGRPLNDCTFDFGAGPVSLNPNSNNLDATRFYAWRGNCAENVQVCQFTVDGTATIVATAQFVPRGDTSPVLACAAAPVLPGLRWIARPECSPAGMATTGALCDAQGYFCCLSETGSSSARCGGPGKREFPPDCAQTLGRGMLRPGGCYEIDAFP